MNRIAKGFFVIFMSAVMLLGLPSFTYAADREARTIVIFQIEGDGVKMTKGTAKTFNAKEGLRLYDGYTVMTGDESYAYLKLDDSLVKVDKQSKVAVSKASSTKFSLSVLSGAVSVDAAPQKDGDSLEIRAGNSALAVRGTVFAVEINVDGNFFAVMFEGSADIDGERLETGRTVTIVDKQTDEGSSVNIGNLELNDGLSLFLLEAIVENSERLVELGIFTGDELKTVSEMINVKNEEKERERQLETTVSPAPMPLIIKAADPEATAVPTAAPTPVITAAPTPAPEPDSQGTLITTSAPTEIPTQVPTQIPTQVPTQVPTEIPTQIPTQVPTEIPTQIPTQIPTEIPTEIPTQIPTQVPTETPAEVPTEVPTGIPTQEPTDIPTQPATQPPTYPPTGAPTPNHTDTPTTYTLTLEYGNGIPDTVKTGLHEGDKIGLSEYSNVDTSKTNGQIIMGWKSNKYDLYYTGQDIIVMPNHDLTLTADWERISGYVAYIGSVGYTTIDIALSKSSSGNEIRVTSDCSLSAQQTVRSGVTLSVKKDVALTVEKDASLSVNPAAAMRIEGTVNVLGDLNVSGGAMTLLQAASVNVWGNLHVNSGILYILHSATLKIENTGRLETAEKNEPWVNNEGTLDNNNIFIIGSGSTFINNGNGLIINNGSMTVSGKLRNDGKITGTGTITGYDISVK